MTYTCAECGGTFDSDRTDADAALERETLFPDVPIEECVVVCEDCFNELIPSATA